MFATIKRMMYEQIREEGRREGLAEGLRVGLVEGLRIGLAEGLKEGRERGREEGRRQVDAEWQDWLDRRTATGVFMFNCYDPPPLATITGRVGSGHLPASGKLR